MTVWQVLETNADAAGNLSDTQDAERLVCASFCNSLLMSSQLSASIRSQGLRNNADQPAQKLLISKPLQKDLLSITRE